MPRPSGKEMVAFLTRQGFVVSRIRGSHYFLARGQERTTVPMHGNQSLKTGTLRTILRDIDMTPSVFEQLWYDKE
jgi:predicted RNA binding protein YcfA (HicA-like mRNA interferase family)